LHLLAVVNFSFYLYSLDSTDKENKQIESRWRRQDLFCAGVYDKLLANMSTADKEDLKRHVFFAGSVCFSGRKIPGLVDGLEIMDGTTTNGDTMRCAGVKHFGPPVELKETAPPATNQELVIDTCRCSGCAGSFGSVEALLRHCQETGHSPVYPPPVDGAATTDVFVAYVNMALQRALGERLKRWGQQFIDEKNPIPHPELGIDIYESFACSFSLIRKDAGDPSQAQLTLTIDLRAKIMRTTTLLEALNRSSSGQQWTKQEQDRAKRTYVGEQVIYTLERKGKCNVDTRADGYL
jgi:hypothetical protein